MMKKILLVILALIPLLTRAQTDTAALRGAKKIIVKTNLPAKDNFDWISRYLLDQGFDIDSRDNELLTIRTQEKNYKRTNITYYLNIRAKDNEIVVSGKYKSGQESHANGTITTDVYRDIENKGIGWAARKLTFKAINDFCKKMNKPLTYSL